ncbi:Pre-mRNA-splicing factor CWC24 [Ustilago sp. UG-2017a]|nr:Pre-mRNA-splicing factor CWC24 [Ustilago sp. UG-2017a]
MDASAEASASAPTVVFKRKRGPASRAATSTSTNGATSSSTTSSNAGPSKASHSVSNATSSRLDSDSDSEGSGSSSAVVIKKKRTNNNPLVQSTGAVYRKSKLGSTGTGDSDDDELDASSYELEGEGRSRVQPSHRDRIGDSSASLTANTAADSLQRIRDDATRHSDWDLDTIAASNKDTPMDSNSDGLYRGAKSYSSYIAARDDGTSSKMRSRGPIRQTTTVRTTSLMDYQPDICKDYKETGYCGFGDTCKFLHDRSDYLAGWQLDVLPNSSSRTRENILSDPEGSEGEKEEEEVPFACLICRQPFRDPIVTRCGHYFCSACAIKRFAKNSKCFACGAQTGGLFNSATKVLDKLEKAKKRKAQAKAEKDSWKKVDDVQPITELGASSDDD